MGNHRFNPRAHGALVAPATTAYDRFGRALAPGDVVQVPSVTPPIHYRLVDITPDLRPDAPTASLRVRVVADFTLTIPADRPIGDLIQVLSAAAQGLPASAEDGQVAAPSEEGGVTAPGGGTTPEAPAPGVGAGGIRLTDSGD